MIVKFEVKDFGKFKDNVKELLKLDDSKIKIRVEQRVHYNKVIKKDGTFSIGTTANTTTDYLARYHEFGLGSSPRRSFIRMPVQKFFRKDFIDILEKYKKIETVLCAAVKKVYDRIQEAFDTNGWGEWAPLTERYKKESGRQDPPGLTDTRQLRNAVYVVSENKAGEEFGLQKARG